jgi:hypothetical protein
VTKYSGYAGKTLMPREIAAAARPYWQNFDLTKAIATALGESSGSVGAWHDNPGPNPEDPTIVSRDCGLFQDNIAERFVGTPVEFALRTESKDPAVYRPVVENNTERAFELYTSPWFRDGHKDIRRWGPWVAYTTGWATFPEAWVWHQDAGNPVGPWVPTGRYIHRAIAGQMNYHVVIKGDWTAQKALDYARFYALHFHVKGATYSIKSGIVAATYDKAPTADPADGVGPRPVPNNGV